MKSLLIYTGTSAILQERDFLFINNAHLSARNPATASKLLKFHNKLSKTAPIFGHTDPC
jgi:hypothetical protein